VAGPLAGRCSFCDAENACRGAGQCSVARSQCPAPAITGLAPAQGIRAGGAAVVIVGNDFGSSVNNVAAVSVGNTECADVVYVNTSAVVCVTAPCTGTCHGNVMMLAYGQPISGPTFTYVANPTVGAVAPSTVCQRSPVCA